MIEEYDRPVMIEMPPKKVYITETVLRDAHQSLAATRMSIEDMLPICQALDAVGYWSVECWGGATFDACIRYLNEDPWERLRKLRGAMPNTKLQMLLRGQNLLGYRHYADDVVDVFCQKSIENGIDIVRVFDALNDIRNMETAMHCIKKYNAHCEAALCYTISPVHKEDYFVDMAKKLEAMGADSICIKDMAGLLNPTAAYSLVCRLKETVSIPIHLHTHDTMGTGAMVYLMAAIAGVDIIDCALSPFSGGASQPATEAMITALAETNRTTGIDPEQLTHIADYFRNISDRLKTNGLFRDTIRLPEPQVLKYQIPGGMVSNLVSQLKQLNAEARLDEVCREIPKVRKDFGYPPLVTPTSQIIGTQAVLNIMAEERYKMLPKESKMLLRGEYGKLPGAVNELLQKRAAEEAPIITCRPADLISSEWDDLSKSQDPFLKTDEDRLVFALFPQIGRQFLKKKYKLEGEQIHCISAQWKTAE